MTEEIENKVTVRTQYDPDVNLVPHSISELQHIAKIFSDSSLVPKHFQGKPQDCFIALEMAYRMRLSPSMALQNIYVMNGKPGLSAALVIALINKSGLIQGGIKYRQSPKGQPLEVTAYAKALDGEEISYTVTMEMAKAECWDKNPKYRSIPELMLRYRAATFLARLYFPEVIMGMHTVEELSENSEYDNASQSKVVATAVTKGPSSALSRLKEQAAIAVKNNAIEADSE